MRPTDLQGWRPIGDGFGVVWAGDSWTFGFRDGRAGLIREGTTEPCLALVGLAATYRRDDRAFAADSLVTLEVVRGRLLATFDPPGWHGLTVRAGWGLGCDGRGMDLEIQAVATSVGKLRRLEILTEPHPGLDADATSPPRVKPRDRRAAGASYDGREPADVLARLTTLPVGQRSIDELRDGWFEIAHPEDVARTIRTESGGVRHALFGHDLERGVVLRGRLRRILPDDPNALAAERERFLAEPPPLRTD